MPIAASLLSELDQELAGTRKILERVPEDRFAWQPHEKSMTLGRLATHLSEIPGWATNAIRLDELDIMPPGSPPFQPETLPTRQAILDQFDRNAAEARATLANAADAELTKPWTLKAGGRAFLTMPKVAVYRSLALNHLIHHRGQMTVLLRLCDVPLPPLYGPTADERML